MERKKKFSVLCSLMLFFAIMLSAASHAAGEVVPITELKDKLESISEEEKKVLAELFSLEQEIIALEADERKLSEEIKQLQKSIKQLEESIEEKQEAYDNRCQILKQVLVNYQRRGPASYIEILLQAENLSSFIKSLNILKDISRNTRELLDELKERQRELIDKKAALEEENVLLVQKRAELEADISKKLQLVRQKEDYLESLKQESEYFSQQLELVLRMWDNCLKLFAEVSKEITEIINGGYITAEDLNIGFGFFSISGYIEEDTINDALSEHSRLSNTIFRFEDGRAIIEVPDERLKLIGDFVVTGNKEVSFQAQEGYFFDLPLEKSSIDEIFSNGSLTINFEQIADDIVFIDFRITDVSCEDGKLGFTVIPQF